MESASNEQAPSITLRSVLRQGLRYVLHVIAVYVIVNTTTMWLAWFLYGRLLPLVEHHAPTVSSFQFAFSHLFEFSFLPAMIVGFLYSQWLRHRVALFVWVIPLAALAYKFVTFNPATVFQSHFDAAFHQYFGGNFIIPEWHSYEDLFRIAASSPDMPRGLEQLHYTAPFYAALGYGLGTLLALRFPIGVLEKLKPTLRSVLAPRALPPMDKHGTAR